MLQHSGRYLSINKSKQSMCASNSFTRNDETGVPLNRDSFIINHSIVNVFVACIRFL